MQPSPASDLLPQGQTDLARFDNSYFKPAPSWKLLTWFVMNSLVLNNYLPLPVSLKVFVLRLFGAKIGQGVMIKPGVNIKYPWFLTVGNYVWIGEQVWIDNLAPVTIGDNACLSQGALLLTGNHNYSKPTFDMIIKPIHVEAGAWVGAKTVVGPGVTVGSHAVLGMGAVTAKSLDPYGIYQGNPAVWVRKRVITT